MIRFLLPTIAAAFLLAAPVAVSAATTAAKPMAAKPAKPAKPMVHKASKPMKPVARRPDAGNAAVDALNEQSLARAKAGQ